MKKRRTSDWYAYGDARFEELVVKIRKVFRHALRTCNFDEINAPKAQVLSREIYTKLIRMNRRYFRDLWDWCYEFEYDWLALYGVFPEFGDLTDADTLKKLSQLEQTVEVKKIKPGETASGLSSGALDRRVDKVLKRYDPMMKYRYDTEAERKRSRFFEAIVADGETKRRREFDNDFNTAEKLWQRQTKQYFINVEDDARKDAIRDITGDADPEVVWITMMDEKVCKDCAPRHGQHYRMSMLPDKHPNCRCRIVPVRKV